MAQQQAADPIAIYEGAVQQTRRFIAAIKPDQLHDPTPCSEWDVQQLLDHQATVTGFVIGVLSGTPPTGPGEEADNLERYDAGTSKVLGLAKPPGAMDKTMQTPMGEMTGMAFMGLIPIWDMLIHGWDLAKATGQDTKLDPVLVEAAAATFIPMVPQFAGRGMFAEAIHVPGDADTQTRLLALAGRQP